MKRKVWMFPRCKRKAGPTEIGLMLRALSNALADSTDNTLDQDTQDKLIQTFNSFKLKDGGTLQHMQSGGFRTYVSYFNQLGLIFKSEAGATYLTLAGEKLAQLSEPAAVLRKQVLRMQFPSPYSIGRGVDIDEKVFVRPSIFVAQMLRDPELLGFISKEDIALACIYGRTDSDLKKVIEKCKKCRKQFSSLHSTSSDDKVAKSILHVIDDPRADLYTNLTDRNWIDPEYVYKRIADVLNIANTLMNRLISNGILIKDASKSVFNSLQYSLNKNFENEIDAIAREPIEERSNHTSIEGWQRRLGRGKNNKDNRKLLKSRLFDLSSPEEHIRQATIKKINSFGSLFDVEDFCSELSRNVGKTEKEIRNIVDDVLPTAKGEIESQLVAAAQDSKKATEFEVNVNHYLKNRFPEAIVKHVGNEVRKDKSETRHNFCDVIFCSSEHRVIQMDMKATEKKNGYDYSATDSSKSEDYAKKSTEQIFPHKDCEQSCFAIIAFSFSEASYRHAERSRDRTGVPFKLIRINDLIEMANRQSPDDVDFVSATESFSSTF